MTFREAAALARDANVKELWLTHYSPSLIHPEEYMDMVRGIFPNAWPGKDGKSVELNFEEEVQLEHLILSNSNQTRVSMHHI